MRAQVNTFGCVEDGMKKHHFDLFLPDTDPSQEDLEMQSLHASLQSHRVRWRGCDSAQLAPHCHRTGRQLHISCRAAAAAAAKQAEADRIAEELPQSREAAVSGLSTVGAPACGKPGRLLIALQIQQAAAAVSAQLGAGVGKKRKGFQSGSIKRLKLDVPQADDRPQAVRMGT